MIPHLAVSETVVIPVDSRKRYNPEIPVKAGEVYRMTITEETWNDATAFRIGSHSPPYQWKAPASGDLSFFANDASAPRFYENNEGVIHFKAERMT